jgi:hypothetical protein
VLLPAPFGPAMTKMLGINQTDFGTIEANHGNREQA